MIPQKTFLNVIYDGVSVTSVVTFFSCGNIVKRGNYATWFGFEKDHGLCLKKYANFSYFM